MPSEEFPFDVTKQQVRKAEANTSKIHDGDVPKGSKAAALQSIVDSSRPPNKEEFVAQRQANLPLPEQPPQPSDWNSADQRSVDVGSGRQPRGDTLQSPMTSVPGDAGRKGVDGIPNDAAAREAKHKEGLVDTTNEDFGYPHQSDPAATDKLH